MKNKKILEHIAIFDRNIYRTLDKIGKRSAKNTSDNRQQWEIEYHDSNIYALCSKRNNSIKNALQ